MMADAQTKVRMGDVIIATGVACSIASYFDGFFPSGGFGYFLLQLGAIIGALCSVGFWFWMMVSLFKDGYSFSKLAWFAVILVTYFFGAILYYFSRYRPSLIKEIQGQAMTTWLK
ncbi:PLDc N-terminal domain-containing protein [Parahaliea aestuarii]|nr:PLDc N-terminal domain-containing protein [Parahaliea aestuarii]